jgi:hypothetical protein
VYTTAALNTLVDDLLLLIHINNTAPAALNNIADELKL